jgi:hypothetical protein
MIIKVLIHTCIVKDIGLYLVVVTDETAGVAEAAVLVEYHVRIHNQILYLVLVG